MKRQTGFIVTISLAMLSVGGHALAQDGDGGMPPPGERHQRSREVRIDPVHDQTLQAIRAAVEPTDQQEASILALYTKLRKDQRTVIRDALGAVRGEGGRSDGQRSFNRQDMRKARELAAEMVDSLNMGFLESARGLLRPDQHEAWDACASQLDLDMRRGRGRRGAGRGDGRPGRRAGPGPGDVAPAFELTGVTGEAVTLASFRGKPVVIEFGSYTCPVFRRQVQPLQTLQTRFGDNVRWVLVYTKEAHPVDGNVAGINRREGIEVPQHVSFEERLETAKLCRQKLNLKTMVLVDGLENKVTEAYGGHPNRGFVIDADGKVVSRQNWIDADKTREALEGLLGPTRRDP
jgi:peroxiredoxin